MIGTVNVNFTVFWIDSYHDICDMLLINQKKPKKQFLKILYDYHHTLDTIKELCIENTPILFQPNKKKYYSNIRDKILLPTKCHKDIQSEYTCKYIRTYNTRFPFREWDPLTLFVILTYVRFCEWILLERRTTFVHP